MTGTSYRAPASPRRWDWYSTVASRLPGVKGLNALLAIASTPDHHVPRGTDRTRRSDSAGQIGR